MKMQREQALTILRKNKEWLMSKYGLTQLGLFGSVARDEATPESDVDVIVRMDHPALFRLSLLRQELEEVLDVEVGLVHFHASLRPSFAETLNQDAVYV